jgi:DNA-binding XRE family transcriptional regulator
MIKQRPEHVTAASVAKEVGVSVRTIRRWEQGESEPSISQWCDYVVACDISTSQAFHSEMNLAYYRQRKKNRALLDE